MLKFCSEKECTFWFYGQSCVSVTSKFLELIQNHVHCFVSCSFSFFLRFVVCSLSSELDLIKSKHMKLLNLKIRLLELIKKCIRICQMACSIPLNIRMIPYNYYVVYILDILSFVLPQTVLSAHMLVLEIVVVICKYFD